MSSTSNVQDLLVNVFRPTYRYQAGTGFVPSLVMSNVTEVIATKIQTSSLVVSDSNNNTYIGSNAGDSAVNTLSNVALGYNAMAGAVNADLNVAVGANSLTGIVNCSNNVGIGSGTDISGSGMGNILIGTNVTVTNGSNNILIGTDLARSNICNTFQLGPLLYGDLSQGYIGVNNPNPQAALDISGIVLFGNKVGIQKQPVYSLDVAGSVYVTERFLGSNGSLAAPIYSFVDSSSTGMYVPRADTSVGTSSVVGADAFGIAVKSQPAAIFSSNKARFFQDLDVSGTFSACNVNINAFSVVAGSASQPSMTFTSDTSTGLHLDKVSTLVFDTSGRARMCISGGNVGIGTLAPKVTLEVVGDVSATTYNGPGGTAGAPHYTFSDDRTTGLFFPGANMIGLTAGGAERMRISNGNIGIGTTAPANALDVSGTLRVVGTTGGDITFTNGAIAIAGVPIVTASGVISNASTTSNNIGGVTLCNTDISMTSGGRILGVSGTANQIGGVTLQTSIVTASNIRVANGTASAPTYSFSNDTSTGLYAPTTGTLRFTTGSLATACTLSNGTFGIGVSAPSATLDVNGTTKTSNALISGYLRDALTPSIYDISGGNISNSGVHTTAGLVGTYLRNALAPTTYDISGGNISNSATTQSSNFRASDGTAAAPAYSFVNDTATGLHLNGTSSLGFDTGGTQRMTISNGNVGIGTTTPLGALDVFNGGIVTSRVGNLTANTDVSAIVEGGAGVGLYWQKGTNNNYCGISFKTLCNNTFAERMRIDANTGNVGIGTTTLDEQLEVGGSGTVTARVYSGRTVAGSATNIPRVRLTSRVGTGSVLDYDITGEEVPTPNNYGLSFGGYNQSNVVRMDFGNRRMGINTTVPRSALDMSGEGAAIRIAGTDANTGLLVQGYANSGYVRTQNGNLYVGGGGANTLTVTSTSLGVNTSSPGYTLDVTGTVGVFATDKNNYASVEIGKGYLYDATGGSPAMAFQYVAGGYRHFVRSRHINAAANNGNALDFFVNNSTSQTGSTAPGTGSLHMMSITGTGVGVLTSNPTYPVDISQAAGSASLNMTTWPRTSGSTFLLVRGAITAVGNSVIWSNATQAIDTNLAAWNGNDATNGSSFIIKKTGIWAVSTYGIFNTNNISYAIDCSTNNASNVTPGTAGNQLLAFSQGSGGAQTLAWTGYLPANTNVYYKFRIGNSVAMASLGTWHFQLTFLGESSTSVTFPQ